MQPPYWHGESPLCAADRLPGVRAAVAAGTAPTSTTAWQLEIPGPPARPGKFEQERNTNQCIACCILNTVRWCYTEVETRDWGAGQ
jgi:hypothetical protein